MSHRIARNKKEISKKEQAECLGKARHKSLSAAEFVFDSFRSRAGTLGIYKCSFCKFYHIGNTHINKTIAEKGTKTAKKKEFKRTMTKKKAIASVMEM